MPRIGKADVNAALELAASTIVEAGGKDGRTRLMRSVWLLAAAGLLSCSGAITAELKTPTATPGGQVQIELVNDSLDAASWSPCDQVWFIELDGQRERDPKRVYCNLDTSLPLGATKLELQVPERAGRFFVKLTVSQDRAGVELEIGPIDVQ